MQKLLPLVLLSIIFLLCFNIAEGYERKIPSWALHNWDDVMMSWFGPRDNPNVGPQRAPGLASLRTKADLSSNAIGGDGFALSINNQMYAEPKLFDGHVQFIGKTGELRTHISTYNEQKFQYPMYRSFYLPPHEGFVLVEFSISNPFGQRITGHLLDFVNTHELGCQSKQYTFLNRQDATTFMSDMTKCGQPMYFAAGAYDPSSASSFQIGNTNPMNPTNPLFQFSKNPAQLGGISVLEDFTTSIGIVMPFTVDPGQTVKLYTYRILKPSWNEAISTIKKMLTKSAQYWIANTASAYQQWLDKGTYPISGTTEEQRRLYENSLLTMKLSQNPVNKAYVASFHPAYGFKVWARDAIFGSMILAGSGHLEEAGDFLKWASIAELTAEGGFHTCYDWYSGKPVGFVEPQYDSAGAFLLAAYYYYTLSNNKELIQQLKPRIREVENFLLQDIYKGLVMSDYSIWEESSDGITGDPNPTSYFAFTQGMAFAGLTAAALIEKRVFGDDSRSNQVKQRAERLRQAVESELWIESIGQYGRGINSKTLQVDPRADSSSAVMVWSGLSQNSTRSALHLQNLRKKLTKLNYGMARYENDPFFHDSKFNPGGKEVGERSPPWGIVTMMTAWGEMVFNKPSSQSIVANRLQWMVDVAAPFQVPVGEALDGVTGTFVMSSAPDCYEHSVFAWTLLMHQNIIKTPNPALW